MKDNVNKDPESFIITNLDESTEMTTDEIKNLYRIVKDNEELL